MQCSVTRWGHLYKIKSEKIPAWTGEVDMTSYPYLRSYWQLMAAERGSQFSLRMWPLRAYPGSSRWP